MLFATSSFWQGVDVVGEALSCVIIDKLPFASPGDPITSARIEAINARRGIAFGEYQIPLADPGAQAGAGAPDPAPAGPRRARRPRSAAADDGLRTPISGVFAARTCNARLSTISIGSSMPSDDAHGVSARQRRRAVRPILKWAGGKRQLLPALRPFYPRALRPLRRAVPRQRRRVPRSATTADCSTDARCGCRTSTRTSSAVTGRCATPSEDVIGAAASSRRATEPAAREHFYEVRDERLQPGARGPRGGRDPAGRYTPALAAMLIYLNRTGYNGLFRRELARRVQRAGGPLRQSDDLRRGQPPRPVERALRTAGRHARCRRSTRRWRDAGAGDFVYLDPPVRAAERDGAVHVLHRGRVRTPSSRHGCSGR